MDKKTRRMYTQWTGIALLLSLGVVIVLYNYLQDNRSPQGVTTPTPTTIPTTTPAATSSPEPTVTPTPSATTSPASAAHYQSQAKTAYEKGDYTTAITAYQQAITLETSSEKKAELLILLGNAYRENKNSTEAITAYSNAIAANGKAGDAYLNKAAILWAQEKYDEAKDTLRAGIAANATRKKDLENTLSVYEVLKK